MSASPTAKQIQELRDAEDERNHRERIAWLEQPSPRWSCGALVDAHMRQALLIQSRNFLIAAAAKPSGGG